MPTTRLLRRRRVAAQRLPSNSRGRLPPFLRSNSMKRRSSYKLTFFDRYGPEGEVRMKAFAYGLMVCGTVIGATMLVGAIAGINILQLGPFLLTLFVAVTLGFLVMKGGLGITAAAGAAAKYFTAGGSSTPYQDQFSEEQALVMKRDYATALALFEHRIAMSPGEP